MIRFIELYVDLFKGVGFKYWAYRFYHGLKKRTGILQYQFPIQAFEPSDISKDFTIAPWGTFGNIHLDHTKIENNRETVTQRFTDVNNRHIQFFDGDVLKFTGENRWTTNAKTGKVYDNKVHWSNLNDFASEEDIKYIWEPARFNYLYAVLQYDQCFGTDNSACIWQEICSFIDHAEMNAGPHYMSSQEIAIRIINWTIFLDIYKHSSSLTTEVYQKITGSIHTQAIHIFKYLGFSKNLVRNNHVLSEAAGLYIIGTFFPQFPDSEKFRKVGWSLFEKEINYQIAGDGSYLQYSMNYHRMVIRLFSLMLRVGKVNGHHFQQETIQKGLTTLEFVNAFIDEKSGTVANYGNNDGTSLFPFTDTPYNDYRTCIATFSIALGANNPYPQLIEDAQWFGFDIESGSKTEIPKQDLYHFNEGGYYIFNEQYSKTFIRCGDHPFRPSQADNLHIDIIYNGMNIMRDAGTYQYNSTPEVTAFFMGTKGHNTVSIDGLDQMLKGPRFVWHFWTRKKYAELTKSTDTITFKGEISAFRQTGRWINHRREVVKNMSSQTWVITDTILDKQKHIMTQFWHPHPDFFSMFEIKAVDAKGEIIQPEITEALYSPTYGIAENCTQIAFHTGGNTITTVIQLLQ